MNYKMIPWSEDLDLTEFYYTAEQRGFENNSNQKLLVDCFRNEKKWQVWILYYNDRAVGSVAAHSLDFWPNSYRICARTCVFTDHLPFQQLRSLKYTCQRHQNITAQFFIPQCIEWAGADKDLYITSHPSQVGTQRLVHNIYCPALVETGALTNAHEKFYRGHLQTFWKLNVDVFQQQLNELPKWSSLDYNATLAL
jgi:hypothetical protein